MRHARHARSLSRRRGFLAVLVAVGVLAVVGGAWAYFTSTGSGTGAAATGLLNPPTSVNAGPASGITVPVTWTASVTGGGAVAPQGYYVTESNGSTTSPACGTDSTHLITSATSCTDGNGASYSSTSGGPTNRPLANGSYTYTVVAVYYSWSASGTSGSVSVNVAAPTVTATVIGQGSGALVNGYVQDNAGYYVYANVTDNSGTGIQSVTANVTNVTTGDTAVALVSTGGPFTTPGGSTYTYRSAPLISNPSQADGLVHYSVNATDNSARTSTYSNNGSVTFDTTAPTGGAISVPTYSKTHSLAITMTGYTDSGSGIASNVITRSNGQTPVNGVCPASGYSGTNAVSNPDTTITDNNCYVYTLTGTDNVRNSASVTSTPVLVDAIAPVVPVPTVNGH